jgi:sodium transport system permease protein
MLFAGAMGIGMDVIAGEKERGTMATMLLAPVDRETIAFGKVISLGIVATLSAMCTFGAVIASLPNASSFLAAGADVSLDSLAFTPTHYIMLLIILIMQVGIFVAVICLVSVIAKSVKEAGTYISPVYMLVMFSAFATVFTTGDVELYKYTIPVLGNVFAIKELLTFDLSLIEFGVTVGVSIVVIAILLKLITMAFNNERTMFNS